MLMSRLQSLAVVFATYIAVFVFGLFLTLYLPEGNSLSKLFLIVILLALFIFLFSFRFGNASMYDPYWSVIPLYMVSYWWYNSLAITNYITWTVTLLIVFVWSIRLTHNWARRWQGLTQQNWRYVLLQNKSGKWYLLVNFLGIHMFSTLLSWVACIPIAYIFTSNEPFSYLNWVGVGIAIAGIILEWVSDNQLRYFTKTTTSLQVLDSGLWAYVRHPNYVGEMLFWWGLYVMSVSLYTPYYVALGALGITLIFIFISIPMMDKHMLQSRPSFAVYMLKVKGLF